MCKVFYYLRRGGLNVAFGGLRFELSLSVVLRTEMPDIWPRLGASWTGVEDRELQYSSGVSRLEESVTGTEGVDSLLLGLPGVGFTA